MMGPFVPDIITDQLNLIVGFFVGMGFGFLLEQAGFSSSRKLTGLFYGTDFTVLRVFFSAGITAVCGVILLSTFGLLDTSIIYIHPTYLYPAIVGGAIMGVGFIVGGFCPGTAFCGAAIGKVDAMVFVLGGLLGIFALAEVYPMIDTFYHSSFYGNITANEFLGLSPGVIALGMIVIAVGMFIVTTKIEQRVNPNSPSRWFPRRSHQLAGAGVVILGVLLALVPGRETRLLERATDVAYQQSHPVEQMTADELAFRIVDKDPLLQLIDVRGADDRANTLPGAEDISIEEMFGKEGHSVLAVANKKKVFFANDEKESVEAATLAGLLGYKNIAVLQGGLSGFKATIFDAKLPDGDLSPTDRVLYSFRVSSAASLTEMINEQGKTPAPKKRVKKVTGGCGL